MDLLEAKQYFNYQNVDVTVEDCVEGKELASAVVGGVDAGHEVVLENAGPVTARHDRQGQHEHHLVYGRKSKHKS
jgi:hypothetical protein